MLLPIKHALQFNVYILLFALLKGKDFMLLDVKVQNVFMFNPLMVIGVFRTKIHFFCRNLYLYKQHRSRSDPMFSGI